jgi:hypothetical protein
LAESCGSAEFRIEVEAKVVAGVIGPENSDASGADPPSGQRNELSSGPFKPLLKISRMEIGHQAKSTRSRRRVRS